MSGGGGKGSGSSTVVQDSAAAKTLADIAERFSTETKDIRSGLIGTMEDVLKTGGAKVPIISRAVEATRSAGSKALTALDERLAQMGLAGTPEGETMRTEQVQAGEVQSAQAGEALSQAIFNMISNFVLGQSQTALSGLAGAIPGTSTARTSEKAKGSFFGF